MEKIVTYRAFDGTIFTNKDSCKEYEERKRAKTRRIYNDGSVYYVFSNSMPEKFQSKVEEALPELNSFWVGNKGYCGATFIEIKPAQWNTTTLDKIISNLCTSPAYYGKIDNYDDFKSMKIKLKSEGK